ncbi:Subunit of the glycosylphosphatidylinositol transamidase complex-like protein [Tulasnella sp. 418]|nr:Subunit of the glycosylphosphatidylinositol transamidase complex-like protein [Tulasnella sp. 418]
MLPSLYTHVVAFIVLLSSVLAQQETFTEQLHLTPLADGKVYSQFEFSILLPQATPRSPRSVDEETDQHYTLFPLQLGQLLRSHAVTELHLNLNAGKWDYQKWGYPREYSVGAGAEMWVWMAESSHVSIQERWQGMVNGLSGLFCASLGGLDDKRTTRPTYAFQPEGDLLEDESYDLRHAFLPSESVCTENLTPFLKLLPCKARSGIAQLLNPHRLFDADWHGIGVHVTWHEGTGIQLKLGFGAVLDPLRMAGKRDWSFQSLFDSKIQTSCPVADESHVFVTLPHGESFSLTPEPTEKIEDNFTAKYDTHNVKEELDVMMTWPESARPNRDQLKHQTAISVKRILTGASQTQGGILFKFVNHQVSPMEVSCVETAPWFVNYFLHSRQVKVDGLARDDIIRSFSYTPTIGHQPTLLETVLILPPMSTVDVSMTFSKAFIAYTEHPPDAERGWDLPPAVISYSEGAHDTSLVKPRRLYTFNLLIDIPTPDFSMPYNVIIMSSTVIALFFGSVFNLLTRKFVWVPVKDDTKTRLSHG